MRFLIPLQKKTTRATDRHDQSDIHKFPEHEIYNFEYFPQNQPFCGNPRDLPHSGYSSGWNSGGNPKYKTLGFFFGI